MAPPTNNVGGVLFSHPFGQSRDPLCRRSVVSARWIQQETFLDQLREADVRNPDMFQPAQDWIHDQIWNNLDAEQQLYPNLIPNEFSVY